MGSYASLSVCLSLYQKSLDNNSLEKNYSKKIINCEPFEVGSPNLVWWWALTCFFSRIFCNVFDIWPRGQRSNGSSSKVTWVKVKLGCHTKAGGLTATSSCFIKVCYLIYFISKIVSGNLVSLLMTKKLRKYLWYIFRCKIIFLRRYIEKCLKKCLCLHHFLNHTAQHKTLLCKVSFKATFNIQRPK